LYVFFKFSFAFLIKEQIFCFESYNVKGQSKASISLLSAGGVSPNVIYLRYLLPVISVLLSPSFPSFSLHSIKS
jgi:hypothetical protein